MNPTGPVSAEAPLARLLEITHRILDADDLVQETYRLAFENYRQLRALGHCRAWMYRILYRQAATARRRNRTGAALVLIDGGSGHTEDPFAQLAGDDGLERVALHEIRDAIAALPGDLQTAVTLCDIEGFSYEEIAEIVDCPVGTVRSRIARARMKLMAQLHIHAAAYGIRRHQGRA